MDINANLDRARAPADDSAAAAFDRELIAAIATGSVKAFERLYDVHCRMVYSLARRIVVRLEDSEEVVQDVFSQVWRDASRYRETRASVAGWLLVLTRTRAIDRLRARQSRPDGRAQIQLDACPPVRSTARDPEEATISAQEAARVRDALLALTGAQRALVDLAYFQGLTHSELARHTGTPLGTVKTRLRAATGTLRAALAASPIDYRQ